ncbi:hypothetical protein NX059_002738 [Plenodomus lindquistii]|nr:hypothetical protein NX059_002738 [Plenodomus lindquistii]
MAPGSAMPGGTATKENGDIKSKLNAALERIAELEAQLAASQAEMQGSGMTEVAGHTPDAETLKFLKELYDKNEELRHHESLMTAAQSIMTSEGTRKSAAPDLEQLKLMLQVAQQLAAKTMTSDVDAIVQAPQQTLTTSGLRKLRAAHLDNIKRTAQDISEVMRSALGATDEIS